ncbi:MAG: hypothetical protein JW822_08485 [Spirochaetales bacterium]|nr:hypothetical protein [Spirochaetales bacterium]
MKYVRANNAWYFVLIVLCAMSFASCLDVDENTATLPVSNGQDSSTAEPDALRGVVEKKTEFAGTLSEYSFFVLVTSDGTELILFNQQQRSLGFDEYAGKNVRVKGQNITGSIGWRKIKKDGIQVEDIRIIE